MDHAETEIEKVPDMRGDFRELRAEFRALVRTVLRIESELREERAEREEEAVETKRASAGERIAIIAAGGAIIAAVVQALVQVLT